MSTGRDHMHIIYRMNAPTPFCYEPFLTQWRMKEESGKDTCFIQISKDQSKPNWARYGSLLEAYLHHRLEEDYFIKDITLNFLNGLPL